MSVRLPAHTSAVVIGGSIMGCSTLYPLTKMGVCDAELPECNELTSGTTWHSATQAPALRNSQNLTRITPYSVDLYCQPEKETGKNVGWIQKGSLSIAITPDRLIHVKRQEALDAKSCATGGPKYQGITLVLDDENAVPIGSVVDPIGSHMRVVKS